MNSPAATDEHFALAVKFTNKFVGKMEKEFTKNELNFMKQEIPSHLIYLDFDQHKLMKQHMKYEQYIHAINNFQSPALQNKAKIFFKTHRIPS